MAELGGRDVRVRVQEDGQRLLLAIEDHGLWAIHRPTGRVEIVSPPPDDAAAARVLDGPIRLLSLAERGIHVLHAAAIGATDGALVALTAPSGTGKSTFAAIASRIGRERAADDLLPVTISPDGEFVALPRFEQPKLSAEAQYPPDAPDERSLTAIVRLERGPEASWTPFPARAAMDLVLGATVATRVYSKAALAAHLAFCGSIGGAVGEGRIACGRLTVPDRPEAIETAVRDALAVLDAALAR
jgi:energy-coupling factor transporter ATP-binding protein EcfA2